MYKDNIPTPVKDFLLQLGRDVMIDTTDLQVSSLILFMERIGYTPIMPYDKEKWVILGFEYTGEKVTLPTTKDCDFVFTRTNFDKSMKRFLSFKDACSMHNDKYSYYSSKFVDFFVIDVRLSRELHKSADASALVYEVKLQKKKGGEIITQNHWVRLRDDNLTTGDLKL